MSKVENKQVIEIIYKGFPIRYEEANERYTCALEEDIYSKKRQSLKSCKADINEFLKKADEQAASKEFEPVKVIEWDSYSSARYGTVIGFKAKRINYAGKKAMQPVVQYEDGTKVVLSSIRGVYLDTPENRKLLAEIEAAYKRISDIDKEISGLKQFLAQFESPEV